LHHRLCMMSSLRDYRKNTKHQRTNEKHSDTYKYQCVFRPHCFRLASLAENATARRSVAHLTITVRRSVAHLTFANTSWRSVQTFLVLLHTEAGGTPAFQSAPLRGYCRLAPTTVSTRLPPLWGRGQASPLQRQRFLVLGDRNSNAFWRSSCRLRRRNRPAVGCPPYVCQDMLENICQHVLAFSSNFFGAITHRGGRDARVPVHAASRRLSACADAIQLNV
ncbi:MAG: hypothetical protein LBQ66_07255, partial [Planctomycetaceae bacterium]|nr:hypothetical protein [Planctomycetaceae bacterium]